jgi:NAD(P)-dependent dehydrogenase (short-subunit alcohol dehydrogenase family)
MENGRIVVVTGGAGGIGSKIVDRFLAREHWESRAGEALLRFGPVQAWVSVGPEICVDKVEKHLYLRGQTR